MESRQPIAGSQNACPSCRTRLRISLKATAETEFACPECGEALSAHSTPNGDVEISAIECVTAFDKSADPPTSPSWRKIISNSRTIAAVVTASLGMFLAIFLPPSVGEPDRHQPNEQSPNLDNSVIDHSAPADLTPMEASNENFRMFESTSGVSTSETAPLRETGIAQLSEDTKPIIPAERHFAPEVGNPDDIRSPEHPLQAQGDKTAPPPMNIRQRLEISIIRFRQPDPVPLREVIRTVEQMCRVRVDVSAVPVEQLDSPITLSLTETTPAAILTEAGRKSGLRVIVDENSTRLVSVEK